MDIKEIIRKITDKQMPYAILGTVTAVDGTTCSVSPIDESADIEDVRLQTETGNGVLLIPSVGSIVAVEMINDIEGIVIMFSDIDSIKFLDGSYGGLIKISELVSKLNAIESDINNLKSAFSSWVVVPNDGGAALKAAAASWAGSSLTETTEGDIENDKITHGTI